MTGPRPARRSRRSGESSPRESLLDVLSGASADSVQTRSVELAPGLPDLSLSRTKREGNGAPAIAPADRLLSPDDAAQLLGLSAYTVRQLARERRIPAIRLGRYWRFRRSSLEQWITQQERTSR